MLVQAPKVPNLVGDFRPANFRNGFQVGGMHESEKPVGVTIRADPSVNAYESLRDPNDVQAVAAPVRYHVPHFPRHRMRAHRVVCFVYHDAHRAD